MKKKVILISAVLIVFTLIAWKSVLSFEPDRLSEQNELVQSADSFMEDSLYIRAIPLYEQAYSMNIDSTNTVVEDKLLEAYKLNDDFDKYYNILEDRISKGTATESEITIVADNYINNNKVQTAIDYIKKGLEYYPDSEVLTKYYEDNRYFFSQNYAYYSELGSITSNSDYILYKDYPVTDEDDIDNTNNTELWGYVDINGKILISPQFEKATNFYNGYAIVQLDGDIFVINEKGKKYSIPQESVSDFKGITLNTLRIKTDNQWHLANLDFKPYDNIAYDDILSFSENLCAVNSNGSWGFIDSHLDLIIDTKYESVAFDDNEQCFNQNRAFVKTNGSYILIDNEGNQIGSDSYEDAKPFSIDGSLACVKNNGLWGFIDINGNLVIDYQYNDAYSFSNYVAPVFNGLYWQYISCSNQPINDYEYLEATQFINGTAKVLTEDGWLLVNLEVY